MFPNNEWKINEMKFLLTKIDATGNNYNGKNFPTGSRRRYTARVPDIELFVDTNILYVQKFLTVKNRTGWVILIAIDDNLIKTTEVLFLKHTV